MPASHRTSRPVAKRDAFADHCAELLSPLGPVRTKRMFGGWGFYVDDVFVAIIAFDRFFLKMDASTQPRFEAEGCEPFVYEGKSEKRVSMNYWTAPEAAMESSDAMRPWARLAMEAALRARNAKPVPKNAPKKTSKKKATTAAVKPRSAPATPAPKPTATTSRAPVAKKTPKQTVKPAAKKPPTR